MPLYVYRNPLTGEDTEVLQGMNDAHEYEEDGVKFKRIFTSPQAAIDTKVDPFSKRKFLEKTEKAGTTVGDMWDRSRDLSEHRAGVIGENSDPVKNKFFKKFEANAGGSRHAKDPRGQKKYKMDQKGNVAEKK